MNETPFGPRASILRIGVCEKLDDEVWYMPGWQFDWRNDIRVLDRGCPFLHDEQDRHVGYLGWRWEELRDLSAAQVELSMLPSTDPRV